MCIRDRNFLVLVLYGLSIWISKRIAKSTANINHEVKVAYVVALFMCLMPFFHLSQTHRHTFIFLAPVWVALRFIYKLDENLQRSQFFSRFTIILFIGFNFLPLYFLDVYQVKNLAGVSFASGIIPSLLMATEPIWLNLLLLITIVCYGMLITNVQINRRLALITESKE